MYLTDRKQFIVDTKQWTIDKQKFLLEIHGHENRLMAAQLQDYQQLMHQNSVEEYRRGYDDGKTDTGIAMMNGGSMLNYSDGYHAALTQFEDFELDLHSDTVSSTFLSLYNEAITKGNQGDAIFYRDMIFSHLEEEFTEKFEEEEEEESFSPLPTPRRTQDRLEFLEQLEDSNAETFKPLDN